MVGGELNERFFSSLSVSSAVKKNKCNPYTGLSDVNFSPSELVHQRYKTTEKTKDLWILGQPQKSDHNTEQRSI